jgi:hypothetical protein
MAAATASVNGYLTSTDWSTFNSKGAGTVTSVTATAPITSTGGATPVIAMPAATTSVNGYLTSTDWNTFNSKGAGPAFSAYQSSAQTLSSATTTKIQFQTELFDTNNNFDSTTNYRFTPTVAGYYQVNAAVQVAVAFTGGTIYLYKNGSGVATGMAVNASGGTFILSYLVQMNGSTDYLEVFANLAIGQALAGGTNFQASMTRSG